MASLPWLTQQTQSKTGAILMTDLKLLKLESKYCALDPDRRTYCPQAKVGHRANAKRGEHTHTKPSVMGKDVAWSVTSMRKLAMIEGCVLLTSMLDYRWL